MILFLGENMTYGEIKIEALKLMFASTDQVLVEEYIDIYEQDENFRDYLSAMPGAINRALARIEEKRLLAPKTRTFKHHEGALTAGFIRFDAGVIRDFYDIERVVMESEYGEYDGDCDFMREGNTIVLPRYAEDDGITYTLIYAPKAERVSSATENENEICVPEGVAAVIPYFIKGDLFRADEPNEASEARNIFEVATDEMVAKRQGQQTRIKNIYSQVEL